MSVLVPLSLGTDCTGQTYYYGLPTPIASRDDPGRATLAVPFACWMTPLARLELDVIDFLSLLPAKPFDPWFDASVWMYWKWGSIVVLVLLIDVVCGTTIMHFVSNDTSG